MEKAKLGALAAAVALVAAYGVAVAGSLARTAMPSPPQGNVIAVADKSVEIPADAKVATFASGCFWCTEADFDKVPGVLKTISGYTGGKTENPTYKTVTSGGTGHLEAVEITYDPKQVTYRQLLDHYWRNVDFFDAGGQFCDRGSSYAPAIFVHDAKQKAAALATKKQLQSQFKETIVVPIRDAVKFTPAEAYHQNFYKTNPFHYYRYRVGCGRDARIEAIWQGKAKS